MTEKIGNDVLMSIKQAGGDVSIFEINEKEENEIIFRCNATTGSYDAAEKIHLYIEHWAKVNSYQIAVFDENRLDPPGKPGERIYDYVFYNFYKDEDDHFGLDGVMFIFDVTEPFAFRGD